MFVIFSLTKLFFGMRNRFVRTVRSNLQDRKNILEIGKKFLLWLFGLRNCIGVGGALKYTSAVEALNEGES